MPFTPFLGGQLPRATLGGTAGLLLPNSTGDLLTWTAPNDGQVHLVLVMAEYQCSVIEVGGNIVLNWTQPNGNVVTGTNNIFAAGRSVGSGQTNLTVHAAPGTVVAVHQQSAVTS